MGKVVQFNQGTFGRLVRMGIATQTANQASQHLRETDAETQREVIEACRRLVQASYRIPSRVIAAYVKDLRSGIPERRRTASLFLFRYLLREASSMKYFCVA